jgi:O-antigen/teichoic acid export membrane protein
MEFFERWKRRGASGFYLGVNNLVTPLFALVSSVVLTRLLSRTDYGTYAFFLSAVLVLDFTSLTGMGTALIHATARGFPGTLRNATTTRLKGSLVGAAILLLLAVYQVSRTDIESALMLVVCGLAFPFYNPFTNFLYYLVGRREFRRMALMQSLQLVLSYLPLFLVVYWTRDYRSALVTHLIATPLVRYGFYRVVVARVPKDAPVDPGYLSYGYQLTFMGVLGSIETHIDRLALGTFFSPMALASFHVGKSIGFQGRNVWNVAYHYVYPALAARASSREPFPRALFGVLTIYLLSLGVIYLSVPWAVAMVYPAAYEDSAVTARWFLVAAAMGGPAAVFDTFFLAQSRMRAAWGGRLARTTLYVASLYPLTRHFGIDGFCYAAVGANAVHSLVGALLMLIGSSMTSLRNENRP